MSLEEIVRDTRAAGAADNKAALLVMASRHVGFTLNSDTPYAGGILDLRALRSLFQDIAPDGADSVDLYFGPAEPTEPDGAANCWIQTVPGQGWFCYFRIYGPEAPAFDGSWQPGDFTVRA